MFACSKRRLEIFNPRKHQDGQLSGVYGINEINQTRRWTRQIMLDYREDYERQKGTIKLARAKRRRKVVL